MTDDTARTLAWLEECLVRPDKRHVHDIVQRRIYAIEQEIDFTNPFSDVDETLYALWRKPTPELPPFDPSVHFGEIEIGDWW